MNNEYAICSQCGDSCPTEDGSFEDGDKKFLCGDCTETWLKEDGPPKESEEKR